MPVHKPERVRSSNLVSWVKASGSYQSFFDVYDLFSNDDEHLMTINVAGMTPRWSDCAAHSSTAARLYSNSPYEELKNWGPISPNLNDYHSDQMESSSTFWKSDITDQWRQQEEMHSKWADLSNVVGDIFSIITYSVGVETSFSNRQSIMSWRQSNTTGETLHKKVVARLFVRA
jgi:hypothetical protein